MSELNDKGAEKSVLSGLCIYGSDAYVDIEDIITINSFVQDNNKIIFRCLTECFAQGINKIDVPSIFAAATTLNYQDVVINDKKIVEYIRALFNFPIHLENVRNHASRLITLEIARMAQLKHQEAQDLLSEIKGNESISEVLNISENATFSLIEEVNMSKKDEPSLVGDNLEEHLIELSENPVENMGVPTPWPRFNACIGGGLRPGVNLIGARPKTGKTTLAVNAAIHFCSQNIPTLVVDTEMDKMDISYKIVSNLSDVNINAVETGTFGANDVTRQAVICAAKRVKEMPYSHVSVPGKDFEDILSIIRRWIHKNVGFDENGEANPHVVIYDYFKLMNDKNLKEMKEYQALGFQISKMTDFCQKYKTPILAFVQLNRDGISGEVNTSIISQSDRLLWLCASASVYRRKTVEEIGIDGPEKGNMKLHILEARFGPALDPADFVAISARNECAQISDIGLHSHIITNNNEETSGFEEKE
jgi:replicative DNA helicase